MSFKATNSYFRNSVIPFGVYTPTHFMCSFPEIGDGGVVDNVTSVATAMLGNPVDYLVTSTVIPEREIEHDIIYRHGRGIAVPMGLRTPHLWRCVFLLDETFAALNYVMKWFNMSGGYGEQIEFKAFKDDWLTAIGEKFKKAILDYFNLSMEPAGAYQSLRADLANYNKKDILVYALPKTYIDLITINSPFGKPLNMSTPILGHTYKMCGCSIHKIGPLKMDSADMNVPGMIEVEFYVDYIQEYVGTNELMASVVGSLLGGSGVNNTKSYENPNTTIVENITGT